MARQIRVVLFPPDKSPTRRFMLGTNQGTGDKFGGWARPDGAFTSADLFDCGGAIVFDDAQQAIDWAKAPPRRWVVVNELMFDKRGAQMPKRMTVSVTEAEYTPWYALHATVKRRLEAGEQIRQAEIKFQPLDVLTGLGGCYVVLDSQSIGMLQAAGIRSAQTMIGRTLVLESDDTSDLFRPLRIVRIVNT